MDRSTLAVIAVTAAFTSAGTAVAGQLANPQPADAGPRATASSDAQIVRELQKVQARIGSSKFSSNSLMAVEYEGLSQVRRSLSQMCRALGGDVVSCPSSSRR